MPTGLFRRLSAMTLLIGCLSACQEGPAQEARAPAASHSPASTSPPRRLDDPHGPPVAVAMRLLAQQIGAHCSDLDAGRNCIVGNLDAGDFYDVELWPDCRTDGFYAGVTAASPPLMSGLPTTGSRASARARLAEGQFLCVQATARTGQQPAYYYVAAIPTSLVSACKRQAQCAGYGVRTIRLERDTSHASKCSLTADGRAGPGCPAGWIEASSIEVFSNGI